jgi:hypothetical protein
MTISAKTAVLIDAVKREGFDGLPPAERRRLADLFRYFADKADPPKNDVPKSGVLADLRTHGRMD